MVSVSNVDQYLDGACDNGVSFLDDEQIALQAFMAHSSAEVQNEDNCKMDEDLKHSMVLWKEYELLSHVDLDLNSVCYVLSL